jgi:peptide/nickel transport system substrate-binding protein
MAGRIEGMLWALAAALGLATAAGAAEAPRAGGTAIVGVAGDPGHLNPAISTAGPLHAVAGSLYNGLVALDRDGTPLPDLARSWDISADGRTVTFRLVPGVRWHDGQPFSSADVKFSFDEVLLRLHARARAGLAPAIKAIETPDALTVVFHLHRAHPALLRQLDVTEAPHRRAPPLCRQRSEPEPGQPAPRGHGPLPLRELPPR